jgi:3-oxoacyl-[acyl-carrier protein] reductase
LLGPFYLARNVLPVMVEQQYGRILNISSSAAVLPIVGASAYCTAKAGLDMLTRVLAKELDGTGVTANGLYPSMVDTDMQSDVRSVDTSESRLDFTTWHDMYEQGQLASPEDAARLIYWLVGPWSRRHNGVIFQSTDQTWVQQVSADLGE